MGSNDMLNDRELSSEGLSDADLKLIVSQASGGDSAAFALLYDEYLSPVYRFIYFRVRHKETAEDLSQTVFLKAWSRIDQFEDRGVSLLAWLYTIARNLTIDHWKRKHDVVVAEPAAVFDIISDDKHGTKKAIDRLDLNAVMAEAVKTLSEDQQEVIIMRHIEEMSYSEIAEVTGKSEEALRALNHRAMKVLKETLKDYKE